VVQQFGPTMSSRSGGIHDDVGLGSSGGAPTPAPQHRARSAVEGWYCHSSLINISWVVDCCVGLFVSRYFVFFRVKHSDLGGAEWDKTIAVHVGIDKHVMVTKPNSWVGEYLEAIE
jgi:hypothetical protein